MNKKMKKLGIIAGVAGSFVGFAGIIVLLASRQIVSVPVGKLMLVALFGIYVGFGVLVIVHRLVMKLD